MGVSRGAGAMVQAGGGGQDPGGGFGSRWEGRDISQGDIPVRN